LKPVVVPGMEGCGEEGVDGGGKVTAALRLAMMHSR